MTTIEGFATDGALHKLQQAFIDHDAFQCGYCTPGLICSAVGLIAEGKAKSADELYEQPVRRNLRVSEQFPPRQYRRARHLRRVQSGQPVRAGPRREYLSHQRQARRRIRRPRRARAKPRVRDPLRPARSRAHTAPFGVGQSAGCYVSIGGPENQIRRRCRSRARIGLFDQRQVLQPLGPKIRDHDVQHGEPDMLPLATHRLVVQRSANRLRRRQSGRFVSGGVRSR